MSPKARHITLYKVADRVGWGWILTSEIDKAHAYQLNSRGELAKKAAMSTPLQPRLRGADKLASAFSITPKGFEVLLKHYFGQPAIQLMLRDFFWTIFEEDGSRILNKIIDRSRK